MRRLVRRREKLAAPRGGSSSSRGTRGSERALELTARGGEQRAQLQGVEPGGTASMARVGMLHRASIKKRSRARAACKWHASPQRPHGARRVAARSSATYGLWTDVADVDGVGCADDQRRSSPGRRP